MQFSTYNGWENKFTWLVHLHLSNEFELANDMAEYSGPRCQDRKTG